MHLCRERCTIGLVSKRIVLTTVRGAHGYGGSTRDTPFPARKAGVIRTGLLRSRLQTSKRAPAVANVSPSREWSIALRPGGS